LRVGKTGPSWVSEINLTLLSAQQFGRARTIPIKIQGSRMSAELGFLAQDAEKHRN